MEKGRGERAKETERRENGRDTNRMLASHLIGKPLLLDCHILCLTAGASLMYAETRTEQNYRQKAAARWV